MPVGATGPLMPRGGAGRPAVALDAAATRAAALALLARKPWTRHELARRLVRRGAPPPVAEGLVTELEARGYLDDRAFARAWVESRGGTRGPRRLRAELLARGIERELVDEALGALRARADEETRAGEAARRRLPALRRAAPARVPQRLHAYLVRRGFAPEIAARVVRAACPAATGEEGVP